MEDVELITKINHEEAKFKNNVALQNALTSYSNSKNQSITRAKVRRKKKTKKRINNSKIRILAFILAGIALVTAYNLVKNSNTENTNPITAITNTIEHNNEINEKINNYQKMMFTAGEYPIETIVSSSPLPGQKELPVAYNENNYQNLVTLMQNSAKISEEEFRCTIIAAYNVINEPYIEQVLNEGFVRASVNQEEANFTIPSSLKEYLEMLGYDDLEDYRDNERENIKDLEQIKTKNEGKGI